MHTTKHNPHHDADLDGSDDVVMQYAYDIKGQLLEVTDPLDRQVFAHKYDTAGNNLWTLHLDSGAKTLAVDAQGKPLFSMDAKGAEVYTAYDTLHRPVNIWAKAVSGENVTLRQHMLYGDSAGLTDPHLLNLNGQLVTHYDEAGKATITGYDFKGNPLEKTRQVIADTELTATEKYVVDWTGLTIALETKEYVTSLLYDGLNRVRKSIYPEDVDNARKELVPTYNNAGALEKVALDGTEYVKHIAYSAKGQRILLAMGNSMMTRYAYADVNYRLLRIRSEKYTESTNTFTASGGVQQDLGYLYDLAGNIIGIRDKAPATSGTTGAQGPGDLLKVFSYDPLNRLLSATGRESTAPAVLPTWDDGVRAHDHTATNTYTRTYNFDKLGNVLQEQHTADGNASNSFTKIFNYDSGLANNRLLSFEAGGNTYAHTYDDNGNLLTETTSRHHQWGYDDKLKLFKIDGGGGASTWTNYMYDTGGSRVKKVVNKTGGIQEVSICIDGVFEECYTKNTGTIDTNRHYNTLHVLDGNSRLVTVRNGTDVDDATPAVKYNLEDHLGNSSVMVDDIGQLVNREEYYPFGDTCFGAFAKKIYRYNGKQKDNESGLYNYGMRFYAPWVCRFISVDPLAPKYPHYTPYQYAGNKPINHVDIDGLEEDGGEQQTPTSKPVQPPNKPSVTDKVKQSISDASKTVKDAIDTDIQKGKDFANKAKEAIEQTPEQISKSTEELAVAKTIEIANNLCPGVASLTDSQKEELIQSSTRATIGIVLYEFVTGTGPKDGVRMFGPDAAITQDIMRMDFAKEALDKFYLENKGRSTEQLRTSEFHYSMTPSSAKDLPSVIWENAKMAKEVMVDDDWLRILLGSCTLITEPKGDVAVTRVVDSKSRSSLFFHAGPVWSKAQDVSRDPTNPQPLTNTQQRYFSGIVIDQGRLKPDKPTWTERARKFLEHSW